MDSKNNGLIKLTGLWKKEGKDGNVYFSGKLGFGASLLLFKNKFKKSDKERDLLLYVGRAEQRKTREEIQEGNENPF